MVKEKSYLKLNGKELEFTEDTEFNLLVDGIVKSLIRAEETRPGVAKFLSSITEFSEEDYLNAEFSGGEFIKQKSNEKGKVSDVLITLDKHTKVIFESNGQMSDNQTRKNSSYAFSVVVTSTKIGQLENAKIILINFDKENIYQTEKCILEFKLRAEEGIVENDLYTSIHIILANKDKIDYNNPKEREVAKMIGILTSRNLKELKQVVKGDKDYMGFVKKTEELFNNENFLAYYQSEEMEEWLREDFKRTGIRIGREEGRKEGREEGREEGRKEGRKEGREEGHKEGREEGSKQKEIQLVQSMYKNGMKIEEIAKVSELSEEEVQKIIEE